MPSNAEFAHNSLSFKSEAELKAWLRKHDHNPIASYSNTQLDRFALTKKNEFLWVASIHNGSGFDYVSLYVFRTNTFREPKDPRAIICIVATTCIFSAPTRIKHDAHRQLLQISTEATPYQPELTFLTLSTDERFTPVGTAGFG